VTTTRGTAPHIRPNVLALPSATTARYLLLTVATVFTGTFVGASAYNAVHGVEWRDRLAHCLNALPGQGAGSPLDTEAARAFCMASVEHARARYMLGGAAVVMLAALTLLQVAPVVLTRRRGLRPIGARFSEAQDRARRIGADVGVRRQPVITSSPVGLRDAFCYGGIGRPRLALPLPLLIRSRTPTFEAVVGHEMSHVARRDVALAWSARSAWYVLAPLLAVPALSFIVVGDVSGVLDYFWRAALLAVVVLLLQRDLLRSREHDADLWAARTGERLVALCDVLTTAAPPRSHTLRRLLARHPDGTARVAVLRNPTPTTAVSSTDGLAVGFLATVLLPLLTSALTTLGTGSQHAWATGLLSAFLIGPIAGFSIGLGLWRQAVVSRVSGLPAPVGPAVVGVALGALLGSLVSLGSTGTGMLGGVHQPWVLLVMPLALAGATATAGAIAELWADSAQRVRRAVAYWLPGALITALLFVLVLFAGDLLALTLDLSGWDFTSATVVEVIARDPAAMAAVACAAAAAWALTVGRRPHSLPAWLIQDAPGSEGSPAHQPSAAPLGLARTAAVGLMSGAAAGILLVGLHVWQGRAADNAELVHRTDMSWWIAGGAGVAAATSLYWLYGRRGTGAGVAAAPLAGCAVAVAFLGRSASLGGWPHPGFALDYVARSVAFAFAGVVTVSPLLVRVRQRRLKTAWTGVLAPAAGAVVCAGMLASAGWIDPHVIDEPADLLQAANTTAESDTTTLTIQQYASSEAALLSSRLGAIVKRAHAIERATDESGPQRAQRIEGEVLVPVDSLLVDAEAFQTANAHVSSIHGMFIQALVTEQAALETWGLSLQFGDAALLQRARQLEAVATQQFQTWHSQF
jgi:Zn-dependent protease with chaperone function